jgi:hypothetical protein
LFENKLNKLAKICFYKHADDLHLLDQTVKLYENTTLDIPFTVTNKLSQDQKLDIRIRDTKGLAVQPLNASTTLKPGQNFTGQFTIKGNLPPGNET